MRVAEIHPVDLNVIFPELYPVDCVEKRDNFMEAVDEYFNMITTASAYTNRISLI